MYCDHVLPFFPFKFCYHSPKRALPKFQLMKKISILKSSNIVLETLLHLVKIIIPLQDDMYNNRC